jgi:hypothetical protein
MIRRLGLVVLSAGLLVVVRPVAAAETALDTMSADAGIVGRLKNPDATLDKLVELTNLIMPGLGDNVRAQAGALGMVISNPAQAGVDRQADWWLAVYPHADREPGIVFVVPATDLAAMKEAVGNGFKFIEHGKFGVYTEDADSADKITALLKGNGKPIASLFDKDSQAVFDKGDISVFIHITRLVTVYKVKLAELRESAARGIEGLPGGGGGTPGIDPKAMAQFAGELTNLLFQGLDDAQSCTIAAMISKEGLAFEDLVRVAAGSKTDKLLQKSQPNPLANLSLLPAGALGYIGFHGDFSNLLQFGMNSIAGLFPGKDGGSKDFQAALEEMQKLKFGVIASSFSLGSATDGALRVVGVTEVSDPQKVRELSQKLVKVAGTIQPPGVKQTIELKPDAEKIGSTTVDLLKVTQEPAAGAGPEAMFDDRVAKILYGPEGMVTRFVYLKDKIVETKGGGKQTLETALTTIESKSSSVGGDPAFQQARTRVAEKANLVLLFDLPGTIVKAVTVAVESRMLPPLDPELLRSLDFKPSFLGLSAATEPQALRVRSNIPTEQAQGIAKVALTVLGFMNAR